MAKRNWVQGLSEGLGNFMQGYAQAQRIKNQKAEQQGIEDRHAARTLKDQQDAEQSDAIDLPAKFYSRQGLSPEGRQISDKLIAESGGDVHKALEQFNSVYPVEKQKIEAGGGSSMFGEDGGEDKDIRSKIQAWEGAGTALMGLSHYLHQRHPADPRVQQPQMGGGFAPQTPQQGAQPGLTGQAPAATQMSPGATGIYQMTKELLDRFADPATNQAQIAVGRRLISGRTPVGTGKTKATGG